MIRRLANPKQRQSISERIKNNQLTPEDQRVLLVFVRIVPKLLDALRKKRRQVGTLLDLLYGKKTESSKAILGEIDAAVAEEKQRAQEAQGNQEVKTPEPTQTSAPAGTVIGSNVVPLDQKKRKYKKNRKAGARGSSAYPDIEGEKCVHPSLNPGDPCPKCGKGKLYLFKRWGKFIQFVGSPFLKAKLFLQQKYRCNGCGAIFSAPLPEGVGGQRATSDAVAIIALLKYAAGFPFYRMGAIQKYLKIPISPSELWKMLEPLIEVGMEVFKHLRELAAQGAIVHNDDTVNRVLELTKAAQERAKTGKKGQKSRKKIFTSGILSKTGAMQIMLFFTGHQHAGENLEALLKGRDDRLGSPIQMSDASTMNKPGDQKTQSAGCLTHCRRGFIKSYRSDKKRVTHVIQKLKEVYRVEAQAKREGASPEERLKLHQEKSGPVMNELKQWMDDQIEQKKVEENSALGDAIEYSRNHWQKLTLFLRVAGAPLTNDELEQKFKMVKLHLKNALFYKTCWGALVGDMFMSLIHTCVLAGENPLDYLIALQEYRQAVLQAPGEWMPWNYRETRQALAAGEKQRAA